MKSTGKQTARKAAGQGPGSSCHDGCCCRHGEGGCSTLDSRHVLNIQGIVCASTSASTSRREQRLSTGRDDTAMMTRQMVMAGGWQERRCACGGREGHDASRAAAARAPDGHGGKGRRRQWGHRVRLSLHYLFACSASSLTAMEDYLQLQILTPRPLHDE